MNLRQALRKRSTAPHFGQIGSTISMSPGQCYVSVHVDAAKIRYVREFTTRYYGVVGSKWELSDTLTGTSSFASVTRPDWLGEIDPRSLDRAAMSRVRVLGPRPYIGGRLELQIGLFAQPEINLAAPYLELLSKVSEVAGVGLLGAAAPFATVIEQGIDMLLGDNLSRLEVGVHTSLDLGNTGTYALVGVPSDQIDGAKLDWNGSLLVYDGRPVSDSHLVFTVSESRAREDWARIPEIRALWDECKTAIRLGDHSLVTDSLAVFRRAATVCPDLLPEDGLKIADWARRQAVEALQGSLTGASKTDSIRLPNLEDFDPFGVEASEPVDQSG